MFTILIALAAGALVWIPADRAWGHLWAAATALVVVLAVQSLIGFYVRRKITAMNNKIQSLMADTQNKLSKKLVAFQRSNNINGARQMLEKEQNQALDKAMILVDTVAKYKLWNPLLGKQLATIKANLAFQKRDFAATDLWLRHALIFDARTVAIRAVRMYKKEDPKLDAFLAKKCKRFKGDEAALINLLYAWILVKRNENDKAMRLLAEAKSRLNNEVVTENWERLANGKAKQFNLAALGDQWYSLYLEEPKIKQQRMTPRGF
ncbi:MAG: hypothetical protein PHS41_06515 [Victivallaceae bacterium]|nr:hypothetical protein [Victivallaceae bacterium]